MIDDAPSSFLLCVLIIGVPTIAIASSRFGVGSALLATSTFVAGLFGSVAFKATIEDVSVVLDAVTTIVAVCAVFIAWKGLQTWKHQSLANRQADFLDALEGEVHSLISSIGGPVMVLEFTRPSFVSDAEDSASESSSFDYQAAIQFIVRDDGAASARMMKLLESCRTHVVRIRSLEVRGQHLAFPNYHDCRNVCRMVVWQFERLEAFAAMVGNVSFNFENEDVIAALENTLVLTPDDIRKRLDEESANLSLFVNQGYKTVFH